MSKKNINLRSSIDRYQANCDRMQEIADVCRKENRKRDEKEDQEFAALERENQWIEMEAKSAAADHLRQNPNAQADAEKMLRENLKNGKKTEIVMMRDVMVVSDMSNSGTIPLNVKDILEPLEEGLILHQVGLPFMTGLSGDYVWPVYEMVEATVLNEAAPLSDTKIPFSKLTANPARCGIKIPVSNQSLIQTDGILEMVVRKVMPRAITHLLNKILFGRTAVNEVANNAGLYGPFKEKVGNEVALSSIPTFAELNAKMKAAVLETGIEGDALCWTMTKSMKALLEGQPINANGVYVPMISGGTLCGLPIYTSNEMRDVVTVGKKATKSGETVTWNDYTIQPNDTIAHTVTGDSVENALATIGTVKNNDIAQVNVVTEYIGLGDWSYQPMGLFGKSIRFIVDPYSGAGSDVVNFVLNCDYGTKTLRPEAFVLGKVSAKTV